MPHYRMTEDRKRLIAQAMNSLLYRRVHLGLQGIQLEADELELLLYDDPSLGELRSVAEYYPLPRAEYVQLRFELPRASFYLVVRPSRQVFAPHLSLSPISCKSASGPYMMFEGYPGCASEAAQYACFIHTEQWDPKRRELAERLNEQASQMFQTCRRYELGCQITRELIGHSDLLTNLVATVPDIRTVMQNAKFTHMVKEVDRAPVRTLPNYRINLDPRRVEALRHLVAEGLVMPDAEEPAPMAQQPRYFLKAPA